MTKKSFAIPVAPQHIRKLQDPTNTVITRTVGYCSFEHLPFSIPMDPNPRTPTAKSLKSSIAKDIMQSAHEGRGIFHLINSGISVLAETVDYNNEKGLLTFDLDTEKGQGLYNGGHTLKIIEEVIREGFQQDPDPKLRQFCNFEIQVNVPATDLASIAEGRNQTVALKQKTLDEYNKEFEWIKSAVAKKPWADKIGYVENHDRPEDIEKIVCRLTAINPLLFTKDDHPIVAYTSKKRCLELFGENSDKFKPLAAILPEALELYEYLVANAYTLYQRDIPKGKFLQMEGGVTKLKRTVDTLPLSGAQLEYRMADGWIIPLLASFRALVQVEGGVARFLVDPQKVYDRIGGRLIRVLYETCGRLGNNPNATGKYENVYRQLYDAVESELKSMLLEQYKAGKK